MPDLYELSQDRRLRDHFNIDKRRRTSRHTQPQPHYHSYYELFYLVDGACRFFVLDTMYTLSPGELMICAPGEYHRNAYFGPKLHDRFTLYFDRERIDSELTPYVDFLPSRAREHRHYRLAEEKQKDFLSLLEYMLTMYQAGDAAGDLAVSHLFPAAMLYLNAYAIPVTSIAEKSNPAERSLEQAAQYIAAHFREPLTLNQISAMSGFSPAYFSRKFKAFSGISFSSYLMLLRLREAASLLRSTSLSVSDISQRCGFSGANYFGDVFRTAYGISPREYRKGEEAPLPSIGK